MALATYVLLLDSRVLLLFGRLERDVIMIKNLFQRYHTPRCHTPDFDPVALNVHDVCIVMIMVWS